MDSYLRMLLFNQAWVKERLELRPDFFEKIARSQTPECLWIGCSDSRVPAEEITGSGPGELFVHRNIANQVISTDLSLTSVLQYGIAVLKVRHIIVCGHYNCGGVAHSMKECGGGPVDRWLEQLRALRLSHAAELARITDDGLRVDRMVELSTVAQLSNLEQMPVVQQASARDALQLHAWVYDLRTGYLKELERPRAVRAGGARRVAN
jgi:carbonic anhydrase